MQSFLPYESFSQSAKVLDMRRLGNQRVEVLQMMRALTGESKGWRNHPATKMWDGYEGALAAYGIAICDEWISRGYRDTCRDKLLRYPDIGTLPPWLGDERFHSSHRAALLYKKPDWYSQFGWKETPELNYVWPTT